MQDAVVGQLELPKKIHLPLDTEITTDLIAKLVDIHQESVERYEILQDYYEGKAKILERSKDEHKANNKLIHAYPSYIVDVLLGMTVGKPVSYTTSEDYQEHLGYLQEIFDANDEQDENTELVKMAGIKGRGYEIVYTNEEAEIKFNEVAPENMLMVYDDRINAEPLFALYIRQKASIDNLEDEDGDKAITVYTADRIIEYESLEGEYRAVEEYAHDFGEVPVIEFLNNDEGIGDFERVLSLIDAINLAQSDTANDFVEFTDALLVLFGLLNADDIDVKTIMEDGVLLLEGGQDRTQSAEWLIKNINDKALENYKLRLDNDIHKFAKVPNMSDENFAGNVSGESMKYKLFATDQIISQKHRKLKTALQKRIRLITNALGILKSGEFDYRDITVVFNDNKPYNELDNIRMYKEGVDAGLSKDYMLGKLRDIDDVAEEKLRQEEESLAYGEAFTKVLGGIDEEEIPTDTEGV